MASILLRGVAPAHHITLLEEVRCTAAASAKLAADDVIVLVPLREGEARRITVVHHGQPGSGPTGVEALRRVLRAAQADGVVPTVGLSEKKANTSSSYGTARVQLIAYSDAFGDCFKDLKIS